jgi:hypothetical protein
VHAVGLLPLFRFSPLWALPALLFTISGYRRGGLAYLIEALVVLAVISAMIGWSR